MLDDVTVQQALTRIADDDSRHRDSSVIDHDKNLHYVTELASHYQEISRSSLSSRPLS